MLDEEEISLEDAVNLLEDEQTSEVLSGHDEADHDAKNQEQVDGRPVPVYSKVLWAKLSPETHYHRLLQLDDIEAWQHLGDLIWVRLMGAKNRNFTNCILRRGGTTIEDLVRSIMTHVLNKIRHGQLHLSQPGNFYGLLKVIIYNFLVDIWRVPKAEDSFPIDIDEDNVSLLISTGDTPESLTETKLLYEMIWGAVLDDTLISNPKHRRALELWLRMEIGSINIKNNTEIANHLATELKENVTTEQAAAWIATGKEKLLKYLNKNGVSLKELR